MGKDEEVKPEIGFRIFVICTELIVLAAILCGAWFLNKLLIAPPLIVSFRLIRLKIETKYDVYHCASIYVCMVVSTIICWFGLYLSLPINVSFISNIIVGVGFAIATWYIQELINIKRNYTFKDEFIAKCKAKGYNDLKTQMAIKFFVDKEKPKAVWEWLCQVCPMAMTWDSVKNLKSKMKKDLL